MSSILGKTLNVNEIELSGYNYITLDSNDHRRLYFIKNGDDNGFKAYLLSFCSCDASSEDIWLDAEVDVISEIIAYWDGVRHVTTAYDYYPNVDSNIILWTTVKELEKKFCSGKKE